VQILVVVAYIQVKTLKAEVEKGFMRTAVGHELIDPKVRINLANCDDRVEIVLGTFYHRSSRGIFSLDGVGGKNPLMRSSQRL